MRKLVVGTFTTMDARWGPPLRRGGGRPGDSDLYWKQNSRV